MRMRLAALDLGSNSFHAVVVDARADGTFDVLLREKVMLHLGAAVAATGRVGPELADRAVETVIGLKAVVEASGAVEIIAKATSALREAEDGAEIVERMEREAGVRV